MQKVTLSNGLTVLYKHKPGNAVVVELLVNVGSNDETSQERGIAHFLEHILFEGTKSRPTNKEISNEIERIGGDFNAYTTNERTCFYVKVLKKHFAKAVEVLSDILQNSLFKGEHIEKEKKIVLKEIDMVNDEPRFYQWLLLQQYLFEKHPCKYPTYGDRKVIRHLTQNKVINYFQKYYVPERMILSIVGDITNWSSLVRKYFMFEKRSAPEKCLFLEPVARRIVVKKEKRKIANTYTVLGFKTMPRSHRDSYVFDVINGILGRGQSGRMFIEIRGKRGLAYDVGTQHVAEVTFGYFAVYASIDKKNITLVKRLILEELEKVRTISEKDLQEAKEYIEGDYLLELEDTQKVADQLLFWEQVKHASEMDLYLRKIKAVTREDVKRVVNTYLKNYTMVVIEGK